MTTAQDPTWLLFVDIDGTVRHGKDELGRFVNRAEDVRVFPAAARNIQAWRAAGGHVVGVTNQGGVALGHLTMGDMHAALIETALQCGGMFENILVSTHAPAPNGEPACWCRKPSPGMAYNHFNSLTGDQYSPQRTLVVGDRDEDSGFAAAIGAQFLRADLWRAGRYPDPFRHLAPGMASEPTP